MIRLPQYKAALFVVVLLLLPACIPQKRGAVDLALRNKAEVRLALGESEQAIRKGDFEDVLRVYGAALQKYPADLGLLKYYPKAVEGIRDAADDAFDKKQFSVSGRAYDVLLRNYPHFREIAMDLSFDRKYLRARLKECSDLLSLRALKMYRQGDLTAAILLWSNILEFEPGNADVRKAIYTASTQLKNLQRRTE